jgi:hypothetical protein
VTLFDTELEPLKEAESILTDVEEAEARAEEAALRVEIAKESYQTARLAYKDAVGQLRKLCRARKEKHPLFDQAAKKPEDKPAAKADLAAVAVTVTAGTEQHGIAKGTLAPIWLVKPGGILVMAGETPTAITDDEYTADEPVAALIAEAREKKITSDADAWREFVASKQTPTASTNPQVCEDWKALPLEAAKINGRGGKLLTEAGYETLGAVAKLMRDYGQWWNKEVKGIGEETAAEISDRFADFWAAHPEYCQQAEA